MRNALRRFLSDVRRLSFIIVVGLVGLWVLEKSVWVGQGARISSKMAIVALAVVLWHILRSQVFPYWDLKGRIKEVWDSGEPPARATVVLGMCILIGLLAVAVIVGVMTGV